MEVRESSGLVALSHGKVSQLLTYLREKPVHDKHGKIKGDSSTREMPLFSQRFDQNAQQNVSLRVYNFHHSFYPSRTIKLGAIRDSPVHL